MHPALGVDGQDARPRHPADRIEERAAHQDRDDDEGDAADLPGDHLRDADEPDKEGEEAEGDILPHLEGAVPLRDLAPDGGQEERESEDRLGDQRADIARHGGGHEREYGRHEAGVLSDGGPMRHCIVRWRNSEPPRRLVSRNGPGLPTPICRMQGDSGIPPW